MERLSWDSDSRHQRACHSASASGPSGFNVSILAMVPSAKMTKLTMDLRAAAAAGRDDANSTTTAHAAHTDPAEPHVARTHHAGTVAHAAAAANSEAGSSFDCTTAETASRLLMTLILKSGPTLTWTAQSTHTEARPPPPPPPLPPPPRRRRRRRGATAVKMIVL